MDFLLDDEHWTIRYLVVDTSSLFSARKVLISPISFAEIDWASRRFHLTLSREKINHSPDIDVDQTVSRRHEGAHALYYGHPYYWGYIGLWGKGPYPGLLASDPERETPGPK